GTGAHERPEPGAVLAATGVVEVRQAEVVAELVGEDAQPTVLRLRGVVADPQAGVADLDSAVAVPLGTAAGTLADRPAVRPDGRLGRAGLFTLTGVNRLEVVDVAVGLGEDPVPVVVEAVPL